MWAAFERRTFGELSLTKYKARRLHVSQVRPGRRNQAFDATKPVKERMSLKTIHCLRLCKQAF